VIRLTMSHGPGSGDDQTLLARDQAPQGLTAIQPCVEGLIDVLDRFPRSVLGAQDFGNVLGVHAVEVETKAARKVRGASLG
jgi:hypothetical protein